jgi:hypothetical protein
MAEGPVQAGELAVCTVFDIRPSLVRVTLRGQSGVIRGGAAARCSVGDHLKIRVTEANVGQRFEAVLLTA